VKLKDVFLGVLIVALLVSEGFLFSANQQKHAAVDKMRQAQSDLRQAQSDLQQTKDADAAAISSVRAENQSLTRRLTDAQSALTRLRADNQQLNQQLGAARAAIESQGQQTDNQSVTATQTMTDAEQRDACLNNLRQIYAAKAAWALQNGKTATDVPTEQDLLSYFPDNAFPVCPSGGTYTIGAVGVPPSCSIHGQLE
jgi:septal ring factor EnvC (AmiA/AmiB activator)